MNQKPSERIREIAQNKYFKEIDDVNFSWLQSPEKTKWLIEKHCLIEAILQFLDEKFGDEDENH